MEGWAPVHGELRVFECMGWKALGSFGELWVGVAAAAQSTVQCRSPAGRLGKSQRSSCQGLCMVKRSLTRSSTP